MKFQLRPFLPWAVALISLVIKAPAPAVEVDWPPVTNRPPQVQLDGAAPNGWLQIAGDYFDATGGPPVLTLQFTTDLRVWSPAAVLLSAPFRYTDPRPLSPAGFYRLIAGPRSETNDWSNQLRFPFDPLFNPGACGMDQLRWTKFAVVLDEPHRVYFQDSGKFLLHVEFATNRLAGFHGLTPEQFNALALHWGNQHIVLGTIIAPLQGSILNEFAIQFSGLDPYPPEQIARWFEIVKSAIDQDGARACYLPAFEQAATAAEHRDYFAARGIEVISADRWADNTSTCYSPGWAVGRLQFVPAMEIATAYADGRLHPRDILLTDAVPAEIPYLAGVISLAPATPNSHVAILSQSYGTPFVHVADPGEQQRLMDLVGRIVSFRTGSRLAECQILVVEASVAPDLLEEITQLKAPTGVVISPKSTYGAFSSETIGLIPADIRFFGGKAANFGLLRRVWPEYSPDAIAFSFDLWDAFLDQTLSGGQTLRQAIQSRLGGFVYPPDVALVRRRLAEVRDLIRQTGQFNASQRQAILTALSRFDALRNIRFRSSTNVEDAERFSGAGLYDSFSGCAMDDLDADTSGPSACDPTETDERGVFRAIQRVYASFYNENAFLERLRLGLDENQVGMALLVHHSTPDSFELANGVATLTLSRVRSDFFTTGQLVTQVGAVSVANPDGTARPEVIGFFWSPNFTNVEPRAGSSLVPFGTRILASEEYLQLIGLIGQAAWEYARPLTNRSRIDLDFEYKKELPGRLSLKQIREVPDPGGTNPVPTFVLAAPAEDFYFFPWGDILAVHRLKSRWTLATRSALLNPVEVAAPIYSFARVEFLDGRTGRILEGDPASWPEAAHHARMTNNAWLLEDQFVLGTGGDRRELTLSTRFQSTVSTADCPWLTLDEALLEWSARYDTPVPSLFFNGEPVIVTNERVSLFRPSSMSTSTSVVIVTNHSIRLVSEQRTIQLIGQPTAVSLLDPRCDAVAPKSTFGILGLSGQTQITGLLPESLVLTGQYSQTFTLRGRLGHETVHEIICDPWLEPALTDAQRAALTAANVRLLYYYSYRFGGFTERFTILGMDGAFRPVP